MIHLLLSSPRSRWFSHNRFALVPVLPGEFSTQSKAMAQAEHLGSSIVPMRGHGHGICDVQSPQSSSHLGWLDTWIVFNYEGGFCISKKTICIGIIGWGSAMLLYLGQTDHKHPQANSWCFLQPFLDKLSLSSAFCLGMEIHPRFPNKIPGSVHLKMWWSVHKVAHKKGE